MWSKTGVKLGEKGVLDVQERSKNTSFEGPVLYFVFLGD